jgi:hypothetical protein
MLVVEELKVKTVLMTAFVEFTALGVIVTTSPAPMEIVAGLTSTAATTFVVEVELPQPETNDKNKMAMSAGIPAKYRLPGLFPHVLSNN